MADAIDLAQLTAAATTGKNYVLDKNIDLISTITSIVGSAASSGSGGGTTTKTEPTLTISGTDVYHTGGNLGRDYMIGDYNGHAYDDTITITYNGDGQLYVGNFSGEDYNGTNQSVTLIGNTLKVKSDAYKNWYFDLYASEGTNYAAKVLRCEVQTED